MIDSLQFSVLAVLGLSCLGQDVSAQDWTRFRGPNGTGISAAATVPIEWSESDYNWTVELPGRGHSSPVIMDGKLFLTASDDEAMQRFLLCIDVEDGSTRWIRDFPFNKHKRHKNNSFASSTPCVDDQHVYVLWHSPDASPLIAFDHNGNKIWEYDLGPYRHGQGGACSPIVHEDMVVVANDQKQPSFLLAVDRFTGEQRWKVQREGNRACYSTPCVFAPRGHDAELIFAHCYEGIVGINPKTGSTTWHVDVFGRTSQRALGSPVITDELVIATSGGVGGTKQLVAVRPPPVAESREPSEAYRVTRQVPHVPTPLIYRDWLFLWSDQGIVSCLNKSTGETIWQKRVGGNYFSSPICINGRLYCVDLDGNVVVLSASDRYELLAKNSLGETTKATPAVSDGVLYIRTESRLFSLGGSILTRRR